MPISVRISESWSRCSRNVALLLASPETAPTMSLFSRTRIGVSMGVTGTEVVKETLDIVLRVAIFCRLSAPMRHQAGPLRERRCGKAPSVPAWRPSSLRSSWPSRQHQSSQPSAQCSFVGSVSKWTLLPRLRSRWIWPQKPCLTASSTRNGFALRCQRYAIKRIVAILIFVQRLLRKP